MPLSDKHIVTYDPRDGSYSCLRAKKDKGLDLRKLGEVEVRRVSHIVWDESEQSWFVQILDPIVREWMFGPDEAGDGELRWHHWCAALCFDTTESENIPAGAVLLTHRLFFEDYEDAVAAEIAFLDALRLEGIVPE